MACVSGIIGAGALGLGIAGAAGAGKPSVPSASGQATKALQSQINMQPEILATDQQYDPAYAALQNNINYATLFGTTATAGTPATAATRGTKGQFVDGKFVPGTKKPPGTAATPGVAASPGELATLAQAQPQLTAIGTAENSAVRSADINDVNTLGPQARAAISNYNPGASALLDTLTNQSQQQLNLNGALDPFTKTAISNDVNSGLAARGVATGTRHAAAVAYAQDAQRTTNRQNAQTLAQNVAGANQAYYGDPFQQVLSRTSGQTSVPAVPQSAPVNAFSQVPGSVNTIYNQAQGQGNQATIAGYNSQQESLAGSANSLMSLGLLYGNGAFGGGGGNSSSTAGSYGGWMNPDLGAPSINIPFD